MKRIQIQKSKWPRLLIRIACFLSLSLAHVVHAQGQAKVDSLDPVWEKKYDYHDHVMQMQECSNSDLLLLSRKQSGALIIKRTRQDGTVLWDSTYLAFDSTRVNDNQAIIKEDKKGNFVISLNTETSSPFLCKITGKGKLLFANRLSTSTAKTNRMILTNFFINDTLITCYGVRAGYFWEGTFTDSGVVRSLELYELEKDSYVTDIITDGKGVPVIVAKVGNFDKYGGGAATLKVQRINQKSRSLESIASFPGRNGRICLLPTGNYALVYDASSYFPSQKISYALLDKDLKVRINKTLFENGMCTSPSFIQDAGKGVLAVATVKNSRNTLLLMNFNGTVEKEILLHKDKVLYLNNVFYNAGKVGYLYQYFKRTNTVDPATLIHKKLLLFSLEG